MSEIRRPKMYGLCKPGHNPHWIQMSRATEDRGNCPLPARFIEVGMDGTTVIEVSGQRLLLWNHEPDRLLEAVNQATELSIFSLAGGCFGSRVLAGDTRSVFQCRQVFGFSAHETIQSEVQWSYSTTREDAFCPWVRLLRATK